MKGTTPDYTGELIDRFGEELGSSAGGQVSSRFKHKAAQAGLLGAGGEEGEEEAVDYEAMKDEIREAAMKHMEEVRTGRACAWSWGAG